MMKNDYLTMFSCVILFFGIAELMNRNGGAGFIISIIGLILVLKFGSD